mgnify:CR=1 FL=1
MREVAPHAGAWIETSPYGLKGLENFVAPHAGAWIETCAMYDEYLTHESRAPRGRVD